MPLGEELASNTREGDLYESLEGGRVRCYACGHCCPISSGFAGVCKVRFNRGGKLLVPYGYVNALHCDPIEKKPFYHALPGTRALSFGMLGCDLHCGYCQNWLSSQALRDARSTLDFRASRRARSSGSRSRSRRDERHQHLQRAAHHERMGGGGFSRSPRGRPGHRIRLQWQCHAPGARVSAALGGSLQGGSQELRRPPLSRVGRAAEPILDSIARIHEMGFWLEVVTLVVPGFNDSDGGAGGARGLPGRDLHRHPLARHGVSPGLQDDGPAQHERGMLERAAAIGREAGLRYVYAGNLPGRVGGLEDTHCPNCRDVLVERSGFEVLQNRISADGACPRCQAMIPGFWRGGANRAQENAGEVPISGG